MFTRRQLLERSRSLSLGYASARGGFLFGSGAIASSASAADGDRPPANFSFDENLRQCEFRPLRDYVFGSEAKSQQGQTAIRNVEELAEHFNAFGDATGQHVINGELERYQTFASKPNFCFMHDRLNLKATLGEGGRVTPQAVGFRGTYLLAGSTLSISSLGLKSTSKVTIGQLVLAQFGGLYVVTQVDDDRSITLHALLDTPRLAPYVALLLFMPWAYAPLRLAANSKEIFFDVVPRNVEVGMFVSYVVDGSLRADKEIVVTGKTASSVKLSGNVYQPAGTGIAFTPPVRSAQIVTKDYFMAGRGGNLMIAAELTCKLPNGNMDRPQDKAGFSTQAGFAALDPKTPFGCFPAFWLYSGLEIPRLGFDGSEIDIFETLLCATQDYTQYQGFTHGGKGPPGSNGARTDYVDVDNLRPGGRINRYGIYQTGVDMSCQVMKFGAIITPAHVDRYINGSLDSRQAWEWTSPNSAQLITNLTLGALGMGQAANLNIPYAEQSFVNASFGLIEMRILAKRS